MKKNTTGSLKLFFSTPAGLTAIVTADISAVLQMIEPMALPYAIAPIPLAALVADTITSGNVVPIDTTVAPISISGMWNLFAIPVAPSTNQSPPLISSNSPAINNITACIIISSCKQKGTAIVAIPS